jgi:hypothetical protein
MKKLAIYFLSLLLLATACEPKKKKCSRGYVFEHPVSVYPIKESYNIGDTLWFEMNFPNVFNVLVTNNYSGEKFNENIQLKNFDFRRTFLSFIELADSSVRVIEQARDKWDESFDPIYITGNIIQELPDGPEYKLIYQNNSYLLKIGIILKKSGVFLYNPVFFHNYPMAEGFLNLQDLTPECEKEMVSNIHFPVNRQLDGTYLTNYHLFEQWMNPEPSIEGENIERFKTECFTFVVN